MMKLRIFLIALCIALLSPSCLPAERSTVRIGIIDTGISDTAIDTKNISNGKNYIVSDETTADTEGHGTAIASIIAGSKTAGVSGQCSSATLIPLVFYAKKADGSAVRGDTELAARVIRDAVDVYGCDIVNMSSGTVTNSATFKSAVDYAAQKNVLVVTSTGNDGNGTVYYPAAYDSALCVGSLNAEGTGAADFSNRHRALDILAPGIKLPVATVEGSAYTESGTSFSTAYVSGVAASIMMDYPELDAISVQRLLLASARDLRAPGYDTESGWGAIDLKKARDYAAEGRIFRDVDKSKWYFKEVNGAVAAGLISGTDAVNFSPDTKTTRAMLWVMLYRLGGGESSGGSTWYSAAQSAMIKNGISDGKNPQAPITREQLATMLYRYADTCGCDVSERADLKGFSDVDKISTYAVDSMSWANAAGLISGKGNNTLAPGETATRAETAAIFMRYYDKYSN